MMIANVRTKDERSAATPTYERPMFQTSTPIYANAFDDDDDTVVPLIWSRPNGRNAIRISIGDRS